jgi:hypothetical protein
VIDGELAWDYHNLFDKDGKKLTDAHCFDAVQFAAGTSSVFAKTLADFTAANEEKSAHQVKGAAFWFAFQSFLKKRTGIRWQTPVELNPSTVFD